MQASESVLVKFNRFADFLERVIWTALQAGAASFLITGWDSWRVSLGIAATAALAAALKVIVAQNISRAPDGAIIPGPQPVAVETQPEVTAAVEAAVEATADRPSDG